jgi:hypothetical protein
VLRSRPLLVLSLFLAGALPAAAQAVEAEPILPASRLVAPGTPLSGPGWRVASPVAVRGYLGQFELSTPQGAIDVQGRELLAIRIAEVPALARLEEVSRGEVFAESIADSAKATGRAVVRVVTNPAETVKGIPAGIGRLLQRTARKVRQVAVAVGDAAQRERDGGGDGDGDGDGDGGDSAAKVRDFATEIAGVNKARRAIAKAMGIDPYTSNPLLQGRLEDLAWASVAGGLSMDLALGAVGGLAADVLSTSGRLDDLVWDLPPEDIRRRLEKDLVDRGAQPLAARDFLRNGAFTPTLQLAFVGALRDLGRPRGEAEVLDLAIGVRDEVHARFLVQQLRMLARHADGSDPVVALEALEASIAATTRRGTRLVALPVDHLSWTEQVETGAASRRGKGVARLVVAGTVSPMAQRQLAAAGWTVTDGVGLVFVP